MTYEQETQLEAARDRLARAVRRLERAMDTSTTAADWDEWRAALAEQLEAEREVARLEGGEYAVKIDLGVVWNIGAPLPHLVANEHRAFLVFDLRDTVPGWDGTWVQVVNPAAKHQVPLGVAVFGHAKAVKQGGPNDEAARILTEVFGPPILVVMLLIVVGIHSTSSAGQGLLLSAIAAFFAAGRPTQSCSSASAKVASRIAI